jgi:hypothetical protein
MASTRISRRTVLRGSGAVLALPWLEAMGETASAKPGPGATRRGAEGPPRRMAALFFPNGVREDRWTPKSEGEQWEITPQLRPLLEHQRDVSVLTGLWNEASKTGDGHYAKDAPWLTGTTIKKTTGVDLNSGGISADQIAAAAIGHQTPLPSLELGTEPVRVGVDGAVGYTRVYGAHIAWKSPTQPLSKEINPRLVFDRMTRIASGERGGKSNRPLLDLVGEDTRRLKTRLGHGDRHRLDQYLESVRSLEQRLQRLEGEAAFAWEPRADLSKRTPPKENPETHAERVRLMLDMMVLAFEADITRVCTFMFGNAVSNINYSFLQGVSGSHHEMSHHQNKDEKLDQYERITRWHVEQFAYVVDRLRHIREGDSNVLDNSMILFGSGLRDGNSHDPHDLPLLLAGRGGGRLRGGVHVRSSSDSPMANLLLTMLRALDVPAKSFADSTGPIDSLFA